MFEWLSMARILHVIAAGFLGAPTGRGLAPVVTNWPVALKVVLTLAVLGIITYVHMVLQPQVNHLVASAETEDVAVKVWPLRSLRKRLAAGCLFLVLTILLLGIRLRAPASPAPPL